MKILVLGGGNSTEREVSLRSAAAVARALKQVDFEVIEADPINGLYVKPGDIVFPILHGHGGEDGSLQLQLESRRAPYLGSDSSTSAICFDKALTRKKLVLAGLPVAKGDKVNHTTYADHELAKTPHVLKVSKGGSSIGTYIVRDTSKIDSKKVTEVFNLDATALIEELVLGNEITVSILDDQALPVIEIVPPADGEFDYNNKYNGKTQELCPPKNIDERTQKAAQELGLKVHRALGARHLSRVDIIVRPNGQMVVLELNTMPGMTEESLYPLSARQAGIDMPSLMKKFVELIKRDYGLK